MSFDTVVLLKQNMRMQGVSDADLKFRAALTNMRCGRCTLKDRMFLRSRMAGPLPSDPKMFDGMFRDVYLIVALNAHRDAVNDVASARFACGNNVTLHGF